MKLAAIQYKPPKGNLVLARSELGQLIDDAVAQGAEIIVCPEMATTGYIWSSKEEILPHVESKDGATFQWLSKKASDHGVWLTCGYAERSENGQMYNSALVVDNRGQMICNYRKVLLYDADLSWADSGNNRFVLPSSYGRMAPIICMDLNDDGCIRFLKEHRINICLFCTNWIEESMDVLWYWRLRLEGFFGYFVAANSWGDDSGTTFSGSSAILGPRGVLLAQAPKAGNAVIVANVPRFPNKFN